MKAVGEWVILTMVITALAMASLGDVEARRRARYIPQHGRVCLCGVLPIVVFDRHGMPVGRRKGTSRHQCLVEMPRVASWIIRGHDPLVHLHEMDA